MGSLSVTGALFIGSRSLFDSDNPSVFALTGRFGSGPSRIGFAKSVDLLHFSLWFLTTKHFKLQSVDCVSSFLF